MKFKVEFYPTAGSVPTLFDEDLLMKVEAESAIPVPSVGERVAILSLKRPPPADHIDHWTVADRDFIYWAEGCTVRCWCSPRKSDTEE